MIRSAGAPMRRHLFAACGLLLCGAAAAQTGAGRAPAGPMRIVAAENFYGNVAGQLAGPHARITSILSSPDQDPHLFEASPSVARDLAAARIAVANGAEYDPWMNTLLSAARNADRRVIVVADLVGSKPGDNPHLWYDPATMPAYARALSAALTAADPAHAGEYAARLDRVLAGLKQVGDRAAALRAKHAGTPVAATEPVFGPMAAALGLVVRNERFARAIMNNTEPGASDVAAFEDDLRGRKVRLFLYNSQATGPAAQRLLRLARASKVPVVGVTETAPGNKDYQSWMLGQLDAVDEALSSPGS